MANDRYSFLVIEESLPEGAIAQHRQTRPMVDRHGRAGRRRVPRIKAIIGRSTDSKRSV